VLWFDTASLTLGEIRSDAALDKAFDIWRVHGLAR
jgi:hypothetical protein